MQMLEIILGVGKIISGLWNDASIDIYPINQRYHKIFFFTLNINTILNIFKNVK